MKKALVILVLTGFILSGCLHKLSENGNTPETIVPIDEEIIETDELQVKSLTVDQSKFHFIGGWLSNTEILFIEKALNIYSVKTFDLESGEVETLHEDTSIIVDVLIHPTREHILLHTTNNPSSAIIKLLSIDGAVRDEIIVESSELSIEWNDLDPALILLTAFHQDWTFDLFLYNGNEEIFGLIDIEEPFPKWYGLDKVLTGFNEGHPLDGDNLKIYDIDTDTSTFSDLTNIVYFDTYGESILVVHIDETNDAVYSIMNLDGTISTQWTMSAVSNYSEWVFPEMAWVSENTIFVQSPEGGGQLDELTGSYRLIRVVEGEQEVLGEEFTPTLLRCSPDGEKCLTGYAGEHLINTITEEMTTWLKFSE